MTGVLVATLNHLLGGASWARQRLQAFNARSVRFEVPPFQFVLTIADDGYFMPLTDAGLLTDVAIRLPAETPFLLAHGLDRVMSAAHVEGNAEFATELSFVLRNLRWNAEEDLSRLIGDMPAHRVVTTANRLLAWQRQAVDNLNANVAEYLAHENALLVSRPELLAFRTTLDRLCADLDRLEARCPLR